MKLWHSHRWEVVHPFGYQEHVRMLRCSRCLEFHDHGVRGTHNQPIPWAFDVATERPLCGEQEKAHVTGWVSTT